MSAVNFLLESPYGPYVALAVLAVAVYTIRRASQDSLDHIPYLQFSDGNNSTQRYVQETSKLLHEGYQKYTKQGLPFKLRNPADPEFPKLFFHGNISANNAPQQSDIAAHIVRTDLNKHLTVLVDGIQEEIDLALATQLPKCPDWTPFPPYMALAYTISRATTRVLAGTELARNDEWVQIGVHTTIMAHQAAQQIRKEYPRYIRWLAKYRHAGSKAVLANRLRAAQLMAPILEKRLAGEHTESGEPDAVQWSIAATEGGNRKKVQELVDEQLFLGIASVHSSSATGLSVLYDLLDRPDILKEIVEEIQKVHATCKDGRWNKQALTQLEKLDSFMSESQRMNSIGLVTVQRSAVRPYDFQDGLHLPKNTQFAFPNFELNHDPDVYPNPYDFDPWRFLKMRKAGDENRHHFAYASESAINFGAGTHACPGRYYAGYEIKLILIHILTRYDVMWPKGSSRPPNMVHDFQNSPSPMVPVLFREKSIQ
ncbi:Cytochrome P450 monooxygenase cheE [Cladobotryum mycophilum]|uniref:Cytochrome P450 monooxygenase cheE n=1 Tax=Cladobotryum mycophilum TaxID=491253 RepID=A0ABR0SVX7_9HYPO